MERWIVVTGGSRGIGKAILEAFLNEGFNGVTCARNAEDLALLQAEVSMRYPENQLFTFEADLSKKGDCLSFGAFVKDKLKRVDVLVNNAGYFRPGQIQNEEDGTFESMISANVSSAYYVTRELIPLLVQQQHGHVFTICSTASIIPYVNGGSYCISKHALLGFTKVLREEMKPLGVRVTSVLPGATLTDSWKGVDLPSERFMKAEDIAEAILSCWKLSERTVVEELLLRPQLGDI